MKIDVQHFRKLGKGLVFLILTIVDDCRQYVDQCSIVVISPLGSFD
jgi:hypothetical protein